MDKIRALDPFNLRCSICNKEVQSNDVYALVDLPTGEPGIVCTVHPGVVGLVKYPKDQLIMGSSIKHSAWAFREELSVEEALEVIRVEQEELAKKT